MTDPTDLAARITQLSAVLHFATMKPDPKAEVAELVKEIIELATEIEESFQ